MRIDLRENGDPVDVDSMNGSAIALARSGVVTAVPVASRRGGGRSVPPARSVWPRSPTWSVVDHARRSTFAGSSSSSGTRPTANLARRGPWTRRGRRPGPAIATAFARQADKATRTGPAAGLPVEEDALTVLRGRLRTQDQLSPPVSASPFRSWCATTSTPSTSPRTSSCAAPPTLLLQVPGDRADDPARLAAPASGPGRRHARRSGAAAARLATDSAQRALPRRPVAGRAVLRRRRRRAEAGDGRSSSGFLVDMAKVFEDFVTARSCELPCRHGRTTAARRTASTSTRRAT